MNNANLPNIPNANITIQGNLPQQNSNLPTF